jgi:hypothetical protein
LKEKLHELFASKYKGNMSKRRMKFLSDPFDMTDFFLDNNVYYQTEDIGSADGKTITKELLKLPIGISRTLSLSTMISALHIHRDWLHFDQGIEMCLMGCLLNTSARFHHNHPFLFYLDESMRTFGNWQGGKDGSFSVTGMSAVYLRGIFEKPGVMAAVLKVLIGYIKWMDDLQGKSEADEIPFLMVEQKLVDTCKEVKVAVGDKGFEFGLFRIQIFMTLVNGAGFSKPGEHLLQLMIPTKDQASYKHLSNALKYKQSDKEVTAIVTGQTKDVTSPKQSNKMEPSYEIHIRWYE